MHVFVEVDSNTNTDRSFNMIFRDISLPRELYCIKYPVNGEEQPVQITGWDADSNTSCPAYACKVEESGDGVALLIYGGSGGVRTYETPRRRNTMGHRVFQPVGRHTFGLPGRLFYRL